LMGACAEKLGIMASIEKSSDVFFGCVLLLLGRPAGRKLCGW
jgi:hypothetical protein